MTNEEKKERLRKLIVLRKKLNNESLTLEDVEKLLAFLKLEIARIEKDFRGKAEEFSKEEMDKLKVKIEEVLSVIKRGKQGEKGEPGKSGKDGKDGEPGRAGRDGLKGKDGRDGIDGTDGKSADETLIVQKIEQDLPKLGSDIRNALELLKGSQRLKISAIKDLRKELDALVEGLKKIEKKSATFIGGGLDKVTGVNCTRITVSTTEPQNPAYGDIWINLS